MGWDWDRDGLDEEPKTLLEAWCADVSFAERCLPYKAAGLHAAGPPEPTPKEAYGFRVAYYHHRAQAGDTEAAEVLARLRAEGPPDGERR